MTASQSNHVLRINHVIELLLCSLLLQGCTCTCLLKLVSLFREKLMVMELIFVADSPSHLKTALTLGQ